MFSFRPTDINYQLKILTITKTNIQLVSSFTGASLIIAYYTEATYLYNTV